MSRTSDTQEENHHLYRVLDSVETYQAEIAPWFGQPGRGVQYRFEERIKDLIEKGLLEEVTKS